MHAHIHAHTSLTQAHTSLSPSIYSLDITVVIVAYVRGLHNLVAYVNIYTHTQAHSLTLKQTMKSNLHHLSMHASTS